MEIKNASEFNKKAVLKLNYTHFFVYNKAVLIIVPLDLFIFILSILWSATFLMILSIFFLFYFFALVLILPRLLYKKYLFKDKTVFFTFSDNSINIKCDTGKISIDNNVNYSAIVKICETAGFLFIYLTKRQAYMVDKSGFENPGDAETVASALKSFIPAKKYVFYKK